MGLNDLNKNRSQDDLPEDVYDPRVQFDHELDAAFPHAQSRRLAIALDVNPRLGQKWASGKEFPSKRAQEFVSRQAALAGTITPTLERLVQEWYDAGVHEEVIASHLAAMHERLTDRSVE